jgi:DNA-directed RNA polymerase alpha subunit
MKPIYITMNNIDNIETKMFTTPCELFKWISDNVPNPIRQEQLAIDGINYKRKHDTHYQIEVELSTRQILLNKSLAEYDLSIRAYQALKTVNINSMRELVTLVDNRKKFHSILNIGTKTREEIYLLLTSYGL